MFNWLRNLFVRETEITKELREDCAITINKMQNRTQQMKISLDTIKEQVHQQRTWEMDNN